MASALAMVPVNEVTNEGQPDLLIGNLPPVSVGGAPPITQPRIYFGERPSSYIVVGAQQNEFDYPTRRRRQSAARSGPRRAGPGRPGSPRQHARCGCCSPLRFRDLDLLISDQVTADSQLLFHRSLNGPPVAIAPFLRFDKDPYLVIDDAGRMVYVQDAYTTSDRFPNAQPFDPAPDCRQTGLGNDDFDYIRNSVKITVDA